MSDKGPTTHNVQIVEFRSKHRSAFRTLNLEWLEKYFEVEPYDRIILDDPQGEVVRRGGCVLMAVVDELPVGTCALLKHTDLKYELAKMGVSGAFQGYGIGRQLVEAAIRRARELGAETLVLATSPKLEAANHLYQKMGFRSVPDDEIGPLPYARHSIVMALDLSTL